MTKLGIFAKWYFCSPPTMWEPYTSPLTPRQRAPICVPWLQLKQKQKSVARNQQNLRTKKCALKAQGQPSLRFDFCRWCNPVMRNSLGLAWHGIGSNGPAIEDHRN